MSIILMVGVGPLATDPCASSGPHFRTTLFYQALQSQGHTIHLASLGAEDADGQTAHELPNHGIMVHFSPDAMLKFEPVSQWAQTLSPQAIIGCGTVLPAYAAARMNDLAPVWIDLAGDPIAEVQSKAQAYPDEPYETLLHHVWKLTHTCIRRADRLSGVSQAQCHAMMGALSLLGRLNRATASVPMIHRLPNGPLPRFGFESKGPSCFRGIHCPSDAFLVAWSGSYNTWIDSDLLYEGLVRAMDDEPLLHYVSTGGGAKNYNEGIYNQFAERVKKGPHAERFHLLGWLGRDEAEAIHQECNLGLNIDRWCYEGILGARNRIVSFLDLGVPVATTALAEISLDLIACGGATEIPLADPKGMADTLLSLKENPQRLTDSLQAARVYLRSNTFEPCATSLRDWAKAPTRAGDYRNNGYDNVVAQSTDYEAIEQTLGELQQSRKSLARRAMTHLRERFR